jgi:flagellar biogenesis protein FliO
MTGFRARKLLAALSLMIAFGMLCMALARFLRGIKNQGKISVDLASGNLGQQQIGESVICIRVRNVSSVVGEVLSIGEG